MGNWLEANKKRLQRLTGLEIWFFILGRVFLALGIGIWLAFRLPITASLILGPSILVGLVLMLLAMRGFFRKESADV